MKKVKRFFCLLCCMALIVSMTIDVNAAEELSGLLNGAVAEAQTEESSSMAETQDADITAEVQTGENDNGEGTEIQDETKTDGGGESAETLEAETTDGTDVDEGLDGTGNADEDEGVLEETKTVEGSDAEADGSAEISDETDVDGENVEEEMPENGIAREASVNYILDDAFVSYFAESQKETVFATDTTANKTGRLILGKQRYVYLRLDLSGIDANAEKILFQCAWASSSKSATVVVNECSEFLRQDDSSDSSDKWTKDNINYNNRPLDGDSVIQELAWTAAPYEIDLTDFIKDKINNNAETACIKISTTTVDDRTVDAIELHSSRAADDANKPKLVITAAKLSVNNIFDDVFVSNFSGQGNNKYGTDKKLTFGKKRHVYLRFDLSDIDPNSEKIVFQGTFVGTASAVGEKTIVVTESSEYLRKSDSESDTEKWTMENITYNNRPLDTDNVIYEGLQWSSGNVEIDLTDFIKGKITNGEQTACIHITTATVDTEDTAIDMASSRTDKGDASKPKLVAAPAVKPSVNGIFDDAYVDSTKGDDNYKDKVSLVFGKYRHLYFRFDLSDIPEDAETIIFKGTYNKGQRESIVVYECGENLRADDSTESETKWTADNITYNNRPIDKEQALYDAMPWTAGNLEIDLTEFINAKVAAGEKTACIHVTTTKVDSEQSAVEIYSSRNASGKPKLAVTSASDEKPEEITREATGKDYYDNGYLIQKVIKIKTSDNQYLKVGEDGTVSTTGNAEEAEAFGLHIYQYDAYDFKANGETVPDYGSTISTFAFEQLSSGKFLTIQNYFGEDDSDKPYYNKDGSKYIIKATAPDVNYNERFVMKYYPESGYYTIASHLEALRDQSSAVSSLYVENNTLKCGNNDDEFQFYLEEVEGRDRLKVMQEVNGNSVTLSWKPVNKDTDPANYTVEGQTVTYNDAAKELSATITGLKEGLNPFKVSYSKDGYTTEAAVNVRIFRHMALTHSEEQLDAMKEHIQKKEEPWYSDYLLLLNQVPNDMSKATYQPHQEKAIGRGDAPSHGHIEYLERDSNAAYFNALLWVITGEEEYAKTGVAILNAWSGLELLDGRDRILGAAISVYRMNNAAEILKYYHGGYNGYADEDFKKYQDMLLNVIYPVIQDLGSPMIANGNWDTTALSAMITIGALCDNTEIFERAIYLYSDIHTNGSICVYVSEWGQSVESFRDQAHAQLGISFLAEICEVADKQDIDLYGLYDNRLAKAFNWAAWYNLYGDENEEMKMVPELPDVFGRKRWPYINHEKINRGELRSVYELPLAHYSKVEGVDVTWMKKAAEAMRPQGYVNNDHLNFGTLTTYDGEVTKAAEPYFQLRTRLEDWYQRTWSQVEKYGDSAKHTVAETLNSYFAVDENGIVTASAKKADAPFFQLESQGDGTYGIYCVTTGKYLSVKEETYEDGNVVKADADSVGDNEKFFFKGTGLSYFYFESAKDKRILNVKVEKDESQEEEKDKVANATLTLYLGANITNDFDNVSNNERFLIVYNTADVALKNIASTVDTSDLEAYINGLSEINNDDHKYTEESFSLFTQKLNTAKICVDDAKAGTVSQNIVDKALKELRDAYENLEPYVPPAVAAPTADKESGRVSAGTKITLTCGTEGASIYYTTDKSVPSKENGTLYENPITVNETMTIKAIAVKGEDVSEVSVFTYEVSGDSQGGDDKPGTVSAPTADRPSGTELMIKGTVISLTCGTEGASIYYTTDGSEPGVSNGELYKNPIPVNRNMTIKAIAVKGDVSSTVASFTYTISIGLKIIVNGNPYICSLGETITTSERPVYTGSAIAFDVVVTNNGEVLKEGTDYAVKYANNVKVPAANAKNSQKPKLTITGKQNLKGSAVLYFDILPKSIAQTEEGIYCVDSLEVVEKKKAAPTLYYGSQALKANKDYTVDLASKKWELSDNENESVITLTGKGNFTGERRINVHVLAKSELKKFAIKLDVSMNNIVYDGSEHEPQFAIYDTKDTNKTQLNSEYFEVVKPADMTSAGTKKFTVVGKGIYTGCSITKSYKIKPSTDAARIEINNSGLKEYTYSRLGVTFGKGDLVVKDSDKVLQEGKDYKITYSQNKKVTEKAKYSVTFLGNYKGTKKVDGQTGTFKITQANLKELDSKVAALDKVYKKAGIYKTKVYVTVDNVLLKSSDYTVTYELSDGSVMAGKNKLDLEKVNGTVKVSIEGKGNYSGTLSTTYQVAKVGDGLKDLSKAKITVVDGERKKLKNVQFDGNEKTVGLKIEVKEGKQYKEITEAEYAALASHITYVNNVYKGKATIVINGDGEIFTGGKAVTFSIVSKDITTAK